MENENRTLARKLSEIMSEVDHVEKRGRNNFQHYDYVKASDIARAIRNSLSKRGVSVSIATSILRSYEIPAREGVMQAVDVSMDITFVDSESGETCISSGLGSGTDKGDKAIYKAQTGALKYALRNAFLVPDEADPESDESVDAEVDSPQPKPTAKDTLVDNKGSDEVQAKLDCGKLADHLKLNHKDRAKLLKSHNGDFVAVRDALSGMITAMQPVVEKFNAEVVSIENLTV